MKVIFQHSIYKLNKLGKNCVSNRVGYDLARGFSPSNENTVFNKSLLLPSK